MQHLKTQQTYIDLYDRMTLNSCRQREDFFCNVPLGDAPKTPPGQEIKGIAGIAAYFALHAETLHWWEQKEKTVAEWMERDQRCDEMLEKARPPESLECLICRSFLTMGNKNVYATRDQQDRVLFMMECPKGCLPHRGIFEDGEEWRRRRYPCPKCGVEMGRESARIKDEKVVTTFTCPQCAHVEKDELDLRDRPEPPDPDFVKDRARFCLSEDEAKMAQAERYDMERLGRTLEEWKREDGRAEEKADVAKIRRLTVAELEALLMQVAEKAGYAQFRLAPPEIGRDVFVPFTAHDTKTGRAEYDSIHTFRKALIHALEGTNWRLTSDGISYRLGILSGRLHGYEREEELLRFIKRD